MEKTEYRIVYDSNGTFQYLQYKKKKRFLWIFKYDSWSYVADHNGRSSLDFNNLVSSYNWSSPFNGNPPLEKFAEKYPNIQDWYKVLNERLSKNYAKLNKEDEERNKRKNKITYI